jgi:hypothetical protein
MGMIEYSPIETEGDYNSLKLYNELITQGLFVSGADSDGGISWIGAPSKEDLETATAIIKAHDPTPLPPVAITEMKLKRLLKIMVDDGTLTQEKADTIKDDEVKDTDNVVSVGNTGML